MAWLWSLQMLVNVRRSVWVQVVVHFVVQHPNVGNLEIVLGHLLFLHTCWMKVEKQKKQEKVRKQEMPKLINRFCKPFNIKFFYSTFKIKNLFNVKDPLPDRLRTRIVYKFSCASLLRWRNKPTFLHARARALVLGQIFSRLQAFAGFRVVPYLL